MSKTCVVCEEEKKGLFPKGYTSEKNWFVCEECIKDFVAGEVDEDLLEEMGLEEVDENDEIDEVDEEGDEEENKDKEE